MKEMFKLTLKNMKVNIKNNIIILISITLSSMLLFSVGLAFSIYRENKIKNVIDYYGDQYATISNVYLNQKSILDNYSNMDKYYYAFKIKETKVDHIKINIYGISDNFEYDIEGYLPSNDNEILISTYFQKQIQLKIGEDYQIDGKNYKIVGTYDNKTKLSQAGLTDGLTEVIFTKGEEDNQKTIFWVYLNSFDDVYNNLKSLQYNLNIKYDNPTLEQLTDEVDLNMNTSYLGLYTVSYGDGAYTQAIIKLALMLVMSILAFITLFVIYNSFAISVNERKKSYAMYKSIGASNKQILFSVMLEALIITLVALPIGFLLSIGLIKLLIIIVNNILSVIITNKYTFKIYFNYILFAIFYILASVFLASFTPAKRASEASIIDVLRQNTEINKTKSLFKKNKLVQKLFGIEGVISSKNTIRNHRKYNVTAFSITIGCILFLTFSTFINIYFWEFNQAYGTNNKAISISIPNGNKKEEILNKIINLDLVDKYLYYSSSCAYRFEYDDNDLTEQYKNRFNSSNCITYIDDTNFKKLKEENSIATDYIILGNYISPTYTQEGINIQDYSFNFFNKDKISFKILKEDNENNFNYFKTLENVNVIDGYNKNLQEFGFKYNYTPTLILPYEDSDNLYIYIISKNYKSIDSEIKNIINEYSEYNISYDNYYMDNYNSFQIVEAIQIIIYIILFIIFSITILSIYSTVNTNLNLRRREFAVLRSLGLNKKGFNKMILYESLMLSIKGLLFGILLSLLVIVLLIKILTLSDSTVYLLFFQMPISIYLKPLIICAIIVFIINYFTFFTTTNKFKKDNIADILKEDSY